MIARPFYIAVLIVCGVVVGEGRADSPTTSPVAQNRSDLSRLPADLRSLVEAWAEVKPVFERGTPPTAEEYPKVTAFNAKLRTQAYKQNRANFEISGTVVDEDGRELDGVKLTVSAGVTPTPNPVTREWEGGSREDAKQTVDKTFSVKRDDKSDVRLTFMKEGFILRNFRISPRIPLWIVANSIACWPEASMNEAW